MLAIKLAFKNLMGAGLRTWLNVAVLSFAYVIIIFYNGMIDGWNLQARRDTIAWEIGNGQLWHKNYDPFDPFTYQDAHGLIPDNVQKLREEKKLTPLLVVQATVYPQDRMQGVVLRGIDSDQEILNIPTAEFGPKGVLSAIIGKRMAESTKLKKDDLVLVRWRDVNGTFDAREIKIAGIFSCDVPNVDAGQFWLPLDQLQEMVGMPGEATYFVAGEQIETLDAAGWEFKDLKYLLKDLDAIIKSKKVGGAVSYIMILIIALLAIFDTQVLSIFRRQKEIGTYIALGMTRSQVVGLFTVEGAAHSILAALFGALYGVPFFLYLNKIGIAMPGSADDFGIAIAEKIFPAYSIGLVVTTTLFVIITATIVSFLPARKISKMKPTDALKGKLQ